MYTNLYLAEQLTAIHRDDLLREAAGERTQAQLPNSHVDLRRLVTTVGALLIRVGSRREGRAQQCQSDSPFNNTLPNAFKV
jgi:hypothetical protein